MEAVIFSKIEQKTVEKEVVTLLREAIVSGQLALGTHLPEMELAEQMAVSRIPIREALRQLEQEGLVTRQPNRGCSVVDFSEQDVREVFSLRTMLESMAFEWAIHNLEAGDFDTLRQIVQQQADAILRQDYDTLARLDMRFHEFICIKADHSRLLKSWYEQHTQCRILLNLRFRVMAEETPGTVLQDHAAILSALERQDAAAAVSLTQEIGERVARECIEALQRLQSSKV